MSNNSLICIIGAMECEVSRFKNLLENIEEIKYKRFTFYKGKLFNKEAVICTSGVGKVASSVCTQILIDKFNPELIINTGVAGGLEKNMKIGDIVIASKLVQHDFDATALGYAKGYICNGINPKEPTYFAPDSELIDKTKTILEKNLPEITFHKGVIASGDMFVGNKEKKYEIKKLFNALAVEMEGASIAHAAVLNDTKFIVIRAVSDLADMDLSKDYVFVEADFADLSASVTETLVKNM